MNLWFKSQNCVKKPKGKLYACYLSELLKWFFYNVFSCSYFLLLNCSRGFDWIWCRFCTDYFIYFLPRNHIAVTLFYAHVVFWILLWWLLNLNTWFEFVLQSIMSEWSFILSWKNHKCETMSITIAIEKKKKSIEEFWEFNVLNLLPVMQICVETCYHIK
jgi:hypothetical protein